jgi:hypothetical protein
MTWKPTESLKKADELASTIHCDIVQAGGNVTTLARHRLVQLLEEAIDKALGEAQKANAEERPHGWDEHHYVPATADPVGFDKDSPIYFDDTPAPREGFGPVMSPDEIELQLEHQGFVAFKAKAELKPDGTPVKDHVQLATDYHNHLMNGLKEDKPKRGRPKGKGKKAKKAKVKKDLGREIEAQVETPVDPPLGEAPAS